MDSLRVTLHLAGAALVDTGGFTLEGFGLGVDPVNRRLIPVPGLLKAVA